MTKKLAKAMMLTFSLATLLCCWGAFAFSPSTVDTSFDVGTPIGFDNTVFSQIIQNDGKIILGWIFRTYQWVSANRIIRLNSDGFIDASFNIWSWFSDNSFAVYTLAVQSDDKILVGGYFTSYQWVAANRIIRLNSDGSRDTSFNADVPFSSSNDVIFKILIQSDGKILVGGRFSGYITRLNPNGSRDSSFNPGVGFNSIVYDLNTQSDGKILVGGQFVTYQWVAANRIIRLNSDASRDSSFDIW